MSYTNLSLLQELNTLKNEMVTMTNTISDLEADVILLNDDLTLEKAKTVTLETQMVDVLARLTALESI